MGNELTYNGKVYGSDPGGAQIVSASGYICDSLPSVELSVDTLTAKVLDYDNQLRVITYDGYPVVTSEGKLLIATRSAQTIDKSQVYGSEVLYHHDGELIGKFRLEEIKRTGKYEYDISCVSAVGLLLTDYHYGGIYNGELLSSVVAEIIGGVVPYTLDGALGAVPVYGLLRKGTRRDNLRDLLFAFGGQVRKNVAGEITIGPIPETEPYPLLSDEVYMGGSVTGGTPATGINLTEHAFMALDSDAEVTLFDGVSSGEAMITPNGASVVGMLVDFAEPMHSLTIQNAEILESGANYAVISASAAALLVGKQYTHTERIVTRRWAASGSPNIVTSSACTLVNMLNSEMVADRLKAYYGSAKTVEMDILVTDQKPGDAVTFTDPFGDETDAYIADMELTMSAILKARAKLVAGYIPVGYGNYYSHVMVLTSDQTVTIPDEAKDKALLVLIGGGSGGGVGNPGEAGTRGSTGSYGNGGAGGLPGVPGDGGKILTITIPVAPGETYTVTIGQGGPGQATSADNTDGTPTTFGSYTSEDGYTSSDGYVDLINGNYYGLPGEEGVAGGKGAGKDGAGETITHEGVTYTPGANGSSVSEGGYFAGGGYGGGPAAGASGGSGRDGDYDDNNGHGFATGGTGGRGGTPTKAASGSVPGQGGQGGHGGGGGGGGGAVSGNASYIWPGDGGLGGSGGEAGDGADGIALLFY